MKGEERTTVVVLIYVSISDMSINTAYKIRDLPLRFISVFIQYRVRNLQQISFSYHTYVSIVVIYDYRSLLFCCY